ncbi:hypothetical protein GUJ93_ZPchr0008g13927 [Zizania palustris]|uniref:Uncharacterized protein n=1 Tax=Zizania palustris TaxID=103762 RepID=A0A8J5RNS8_ZIZPA|nr:hypothetical protein GUJ93_ZPchr0008g13927 [Zizania palustris]
MVVAAAGCRDGRRWSPAWAVADGRGHAWAVAGGREHGGVAPVRVACGGGQGPTATGVGGRWRAATRGTCGSECGWWARAGGDREAAVAGGGDGGRRRAVGARTGRLGLPVRVRLGNKSPNFCRL